MADQQTARLPLHDRHAEAGASFAPFAGFEMPISYTRIVSEHHAVRQKVGLFDVSHMGEVRVVGPKAVEVVNGLISHDLRHTEVGQARYAVMCNPEGGIVDDLIAYKISDEEIFICVNASNRAKDFAFMQAHAGEGATLTDESEAWAQLALQGPRAEVLLDPLTDLDLARMAYYHFGVGQVAGVACLVARTGYTGEDGFEIYIPVESAHQVFDAVVAAGAAHDLALCGLGCRDTLRLEARFPLYGNDLSDETNPLEAGLAWVIKLDKPEDFVGRAAVEKVKAEGVRRRLRGFILKEKGVPRPHYPIYCGHEQVGELTSGTWSPTLEVGIALGYVDLAHADAATLTIGIRKKRIEADVTRKPFYKRAPTPKDEA